MNAYGRRERTEECTPLQNDFTVQQADGTPETGDADLCQSLSQALHSENPSTQEAATRSLQDLLTTLTAAAEKRERVDEAMRLLAQQTEVARFRQRWFLLRSILLVIALGMFYCEFGLTVITWWFMVPMCGVWAADRKSITKNYLARLLAELWDPRAVGVLAMAYRDGTSEVRSTARIGLRNLLPRVRASDAKGIDLRKWTRYCIWPITPTIPSGWHC